MRAAGRPHKARTQGFAIAAVDGCRTGEVLGQRDDPSAPKRNGKSLGVNTFFIEGQDEIAAICLEQIVGVLDAFRDALAGLNLANVICQRRKASSSSSETSV